MTDLIICLYQAAYLSGATNWAIRLIDNHQPTE